MTYFASFLSLYWIHNVVLHFHWTKNSHPSFPFSSLFSVYLIHFLVFLFFSYFIRPCDFQQPSSKQLNIYLSLFLQHHFLLALTFFFSLLSSTSFFMAWWYFSYERVNESFHECKRHFCFFFNYIIWILVKR